MKEIIERQTQLEKLQQQQHRITQTEKQLSAFQAAIQTMRKTGCFGRNDKPVDFEWPTLNDFLHMPKNISIKLAKLKQKNYSAGSNAFEAFQVILSN